MDPWTLLQLGDSALPTGGFAHSGGLEAAVQLLRVTGPAGLAAFLEESLAQLGGAALPFVRAAHREPAALAALDARCDAATPGRVANRASRAQGQALLRAAAPLGAAAAALAEEARTGRWPSHLAPVFGALLSLLGADEEEAARLFLFQGARGACSAAVRLGLVGPLQAQELLAAAAAPAEAARVRSLGVPPEEAATTSPLIDLLQSHQERLYSRLFQS